MGDRDRMCGHPPRNLATITAPGTTQGGTPRESSAHSWLPKIAQKDATTI